MVKREVIPVGGEPGIPQGITPSASSGVPRRGRVDFSPVTDLLSTLQDRELKRVQAQADVAVESKAFETEMARIQSGGDPFAVDISVPDASTRNRAFRYEMIANAAKAKAVAKNLQLEFSKKAQEMRERFPLRAVSDLTGKPRRSPTNDRAVGSDIGLRNDPDEARIVLNNQLSAHAATLMRVDPSGVLVKEVMPELRKKAQETLSQMVTDHVAFERLNAEDSLVATFEIDRDVFEDPYRQDITADRYEENPDALHYALFGDGDAKKEGTGPLGVFMLSSTASFDPLFTGDIRQFRQRKQDEMVKRTLEGYVSNAIAKSDVKGLRRLYDMLNGGKFFIANQAGKQKLLSQIDGATGTLADNYTNARKQMNEAAMSPSGVPTLTPEAFAGDYKVSQSKAVAVSGVDVRTMPMTSIMDLGRQSKHKYTVARQSQMDYVLHENLITSVAVDIEGRVHNVDLRALGFPPVMEMVQRGELDAAIQVLEQGYSRDAILAAMEKKSKGKKPTHEDDIRREWVAGQHERFKPFSMYDDRDEVIAEVRKLRVRLEKAVEEPGGIAHEYLAAPKVSSLFLKPRGRDETRNIASTVSNAMVESSNFAENVVGKERAAVLKMRMTVPQKDTEFLVDVARVVIANPSEQNRYIGGLSNLEAFGEIYKEIATGYKSARAQIVAQAKKDGLGVDIDATASQDLNFDTTFWAAFDDALGAPDSLMRGHSAKLKLIAKTRALEGALQNPRHGATNPLGQALYDYAALLPGTTVDRATFKDKEIPEDIRNYAFSIAATSLEYGQLKEEIINAGIGAVLRAGDTPTTSGGLLWTGDGNVTKAITNLFPNAGGSVKSFKSGVNNSEVSILVPRQYIQFLGGTAAEDTILDEAFKVFDEGYSRSDFIKAFAQDRDISAVTWSRLGSASPVFVIADDGRYAVRFKDATGFVTIDRAADIPFEVDFETLYRAVRARKKDLRLIDYVRKAE